MRDYEAVLKQARTCANRKYCDLGGNCEYYDLDVCCQGGEKDILKDAADAIEELLAAVPKWVSVEERLPEVGNVVLLYFHHKYWGDVIHTGFLTADGDFWHDVLKDKGQPPTHWMPLPKPPKEVE